MSQGSFCSCHLQLSAPSPRIPASSPVFLISSPLPPLPLALEMGSLLGASPVVRCAWEPPISSVAHDSIPFQGYRNRSLGMRPVARRQIAQSIAHRPKSTKFVSTVITQVNTGLHTCKTVYIMSIFTIDLYIGWSRNELHSVVNNQELGVLPVPSVLSQSSCNLFPKQLISVL